MSEGMQEILTALGLDAPGTKQVFYGLCLLVVVMALPEGVWPWLAGKLGVTVRRS
jgi:branched-chain amino acid transport system permease protein